MMTRNFLPRLLWAVALLVLGYLLVFFLFRSWQVLNFPHQVEYGEGPVLGWTRQIAAGHLPYKPMEPFPWDFSVYTPGYLIGSALLAWVASPTPWFAGRLLSLLSALGLALLIPAAISPRLESGAGASQGRGRGLAWLAAALWLASPYLFRWATFFRPDLFALWWSALGLVLVQQAIARERRSLIGLAALCFVASFLSKQSFFAAPLAALLYLWWVRRGWVPLLALTGAAAGLVMLGALWLATGGAVLENLILANANPFSWDALWYFEGSFFVTVPLLALLALWGGWMRPHGAPYAAYALLSLLVTISVGKAGAWENYFLEPLWALCVLAGQRLLLWQEEKSELQKVIPALVLLQLLLFLPALERLTPAAELAWLTDLRAENERIHQVLDALPSEEPIWSEQMGVLAESGRAIPLHSFVYTQLEYQGLWEPAPLVEALSQGRGPLLIQRFDALTDPAKRGRWSPAMLMASERGYALGERSGEWLLRPPLPFPPLDTPQPIGEQIQLLNWMVIRDGETQPFPVELKAGETLLVHLLLKSLVEEDAPLTVSVQLFDPTGERLSQHDAPLRSGWLGHVLPANTLLRDEHPLVLPATLPSGGYSLLVTLYAS
ncbi:MAG: glycosyltransferase family 39 protein, partial [Ardenticatenales bacterium]|nr:glycosyltransferase family 39 protein [Ardenticatenales bacterium]